MTEARLTTREVAERLKCRPEEALPLLKAAGIASTRMGYRGPILWDAVSVERLIATLKEGVGK